MNQSLLRRTCSERAIVETFYLCKCVPLAAEPFKSVPLSFILPLDISSSSNNLKALLRGSLTFRCSSAQQQHQHQQPLPLFIEINCFDNRKKWMPGNRITKTIQIGSAHNKRACECELEDEEPEWLHILHRQLSFAFSRSFCGCCWRCRCRLACRLCSLLWPRGCVL